MQTPWIDNKTVIPMNLPDKIDTRFLPAFLLCLLGTIAFPIKEELDIFGNEINWLGGILALIWLVLILRPLFTRRLK